MVFDESKFNHFCERHHCSSCPLFNENISCSTLARGIFSLVHPVIQGQETCSPDAALRRLFAVTDLLRSVYIDLSDGFKGYKFDTVLDALTDLIESFD